MPLFISSDTSTDVKVKLAQSLSARLPQTPQNTQEETLLRTSLVQLGLPTPALTQDMVRDDKLYLEGLAKELAVLLVGRDGKGLMVGEGSRGVVGLDEVWVIWMRARGVGKSPSVSTQLKDKVQVLTSSTLTPNDPYFSLVRSTSIHISANQPFDPTLWLKSPTYPPLLDSGIIISYSCSTRPKFNFKDGDGEGGEYIGH
jgi:ESCRT-II complex subunit VPS36